MDTLFNGYDPSSNNESFFLSDGFLLELNRQIDNIKKTKEALTDIKKVVDASIFEDNVEFNTMGKQ